MKVVRSILLIAGTMVLLSVLLFFMFVPVKFSWSLKDAEREYEQQVDEMVRTQLMSDMKDANFSKALPALNRLLSKDPNSPILHSYRGIAYSGLGDHKSAIDDFSFAIGRQSNSVGLFMDLDRRGREYLANGQNMKAYEDFVHARECNHEMWPFAMEEQSARALYKAGKYGQSKDVCNKCLSSAGIERNSCEGNFHYIRGKAYQKLGEEAEYQNELKWMEKRKYKPNSWDTL